MNKIEDFKFISTTTSHDTISAMACSQYDHKATRPAELELFKHFKALTEFIT